jgi:nitrate reductase NapA
MNSEKLPRPSLERFQQRKIGCSHCFYGRPDGKAVVWARPQTGPEETTDAEYPFYYTTTRILEHWHTSTMTGNVKEFKPVLEALAEVHPQDAKKLGVQEGEKVRVASRRGQQIFRARITEDMNPGLINVHMHDPERMCNYPTIDAVDAISKQPEFKICAVRIEKV